jgi:hypothetical protein
MTAAREATLHWLAASWIVFGSLGLTWSVASLADRFGPGVGWQLTVAISVPLVIGGIGILRGWPWARSVATVAVAAALLEAVALLVSGVPGTTNPLLAATAIFHLYGLALMLRPAESRPPAMDPSHTDPQEE